MCALARRASDSDARFQGIFGPSLFAAEGTRQGIAELYTSGLILLLITQFWHHQGMKRTSATEPPTFTAGQVVRILHGKVRNQTLLKWDRAGIFRPTFYFDISATGCVISADVRDKRASGRTSWRGAPPRLYTFTDLLYLRLLVEVSDKLEQHSVRNPTRRAAEIIAALRKRFPETAPSSSRMLVIGRELYLLGDAGPECLTGTQQPLIGLFTDEVAAELRGRIDLLTARNELKHVEDNDTATAATA